MWICVGALLSCGHVPFHICLGCCANVFSSLSHAGWQGLAFAKEDGTLAEGCPVFQFNFAFSLEYARAAFDPVFQGYSVPL